MDILQGTLDGDWKPTEPPKPDGQWVEARVILWEEDENNSCEHYMLHCNIGEADFELHKYSGRAWNIHAIPRFAKEDDEDDVLPVIASNIGVDVKIELWTSWGNPKEPKVYILNEWLEKHGEIMAGLQAKRDKLIKSLSAILKKLQAVEKQLDNDLFLVWGGISDHIDESIGAVENAIEELQSASE